MLTDLLVLPAGIWRTIDNTREIFLVFQSVEVDLTDKKAVLVAVVKKLALYKPLCTHIVKLKRFAFPSSGLFDTSQLTNYEVSEISKSVIKLS